MNRLPYDCFRCPGENCPKAETCLRYVMRDDTGPRTPVMQPDTENCEHYIEVENEH